MKKLFFILLIFPTLAFSQTSATMQFAAPVPGATTDSVRYFYPGKVGGFGYFYNAAYLRAKFLKQGDSTHYATPHAIALKANDTSVIHKTGSETKTGSLAVTGSLSTQSVGTPSTLSGPDLTTANGQGIHLQNGNTSNLLISSGQYADITSSPTGATGSQKTIRFEGDTIKRLSDGKKVLFEGDAQQLTSSGITTALGYTPVSAASLSTYPSLSQVIQNQNSSAQSANAWLNGTFEADGGIYVKNGSGKQTNIGSSNLSIVTSPGKVAYMGDSGGDGSASYALYNNNIGAYTIYGIDKMVYTDGVNQRILNYANLTANRSITFPDLSGTLVVNSQLPVFDTAPVSGSNNGITSGAIYTALQSTGSIDNQNSSPQTANAYINGTYTTAGGAFIGVAGSNYTYHDGNGYEVHAAADNYTLYRKDLILWGHQGSNTKNISLSPLPGVNPTSDTQFYFDGNGGTIATQQFVNNLTTQMVTYTTVPSSENSTGTPGQIAYNSSFIYICIATNSWIRFAKDPTF